MFGVEINEAARFAIALIAVLVLIGLCAWLLRRFGGRALSAAAGRGRQPRLAVIDAATIDTRRKLILIRRDHVEHLVMIGGPTDIVIEANITQAASAPQEVQVAPTPSLDDGATWPLQPQPEPVLRVPVVEPEPVRAEPRLPEPPVIEPAAPANDTEPTRKPVREAPPVVVTAEPGHPSNSGSPAEPRVMRAKNFYESLEQEMASLLGRPTGKT